MKIITGKSVYVQKNDLRYLKSINDLTSLAIYLKYQYLLTDSVSELNGYEFVKVTKQEDILYIKKIDSILDYNELNKLSIEELINMADQVLSKKYEISRRFNVFSRTEKNNHLDIVYQCNDLTHIFYSLKDMVLYKKGEISFDIPKIRRKTK